MSGLGIVVRQFWPSSTSSPIVLSGALVPQIPQVPPVSTLRREILLWARRYRCIPVAVRTVQYTLETRVISLSGWSQQ